MRKKTDIKIRCNDIEQQLKEWGKVPTNSEDTNLLHKVNNLYRELGDKPEVQRTTYDLVSNKSTLYQMGGIR